MTTTYDLTTSGSSATIGGVVFQTVDLAPTGTGIFNSFLVIQDNPTEEGFNTDFSPLPLDDKQPSHTNALLLSSLQIVNVNGVDSYAFKLDANEPNSSSGIIDLTSLKIYSATTGNVATLGALGTPLYDMDAGGDVTVSLNAGSDAPAGSGKGDLFVYIPVSKFAGASPYVYLYSAFGGTAASNGGFEEWGATIGPNTPTPHATISGTKWIDADGNLGTAGDQTVGVGWTIFIDDNHNGTLDNGELSTTTDANGSYTFTGLDAGTYDIREVVQSGWTQLGTNPNPSTVTVTIDGSASVDFYNFQNFSISGSKFEDLTGDGKSADDKAWSYAPVTIYIEDDGVAGLTAGDHRFTTTDASGNWKISGLTLADVGKKIYEVVPGGSEQTGTLVQTVDNPGGGGTDTGNDFTNFLNYSISGTKYEDLTGNGKSGDDTPWSHAPVTIYIEDDGVAGFTAGDHRFATT
ncbi:SpaA isopeptide-forming pilin-related protein, partial [Bradyrhizobium stylosanthis]|uniref:SpaA isopeptide-forming pilin-related protein n=1 Tax=Bradyrhizobium stylosanthis TaxID=1803665 RepID=UPI001AEE4D54